MKRPKFLCGEHIGVFTIIKCVESSKYKSDALYECECDYCHSHTIIKGYNIRRLQSCGCLFREKHNHVGEVWNRLTIIEQQRTKNGIMCKCRCSCKDHNIINVLYSRLTSGNTKSCGCLTKERCTKHGMYGTRFYNIWQGMKQRCRDSNVREYKYYGGRGITYQDSWEEFENFKEEMYESYQKHFEEHDGDTTLDRINTDGNYCKENCRWITNLEQQGNKRNTIFGIVNGKEVRLKDYCEEHHLNYQQIKWRINKGLDLDKALNTPIRKKLPNGAGKK